MGAQSERLFRLQAKAYDLPHESATPDFTTGTVHEIRANQDIELTLDRPPLPDNRITQYLDERAQSKLGLLTWTLSFSTYLHSHGQTLDTTTVYNQDTDYLGFLLAKGLGGQTVATVGANSDVASGSATTGFVVTAGHGARFLAGQAYAINPNALGHLEAREVLGRSTDTLTCKVVHSQAMTTGDDVIGGQTVYPPQSTALTEGIHFLGIGKDAADQYICRNGSLRALALTVGTGSLPTLRWTFGGVGWARTTGKTFLGATYNGAAPVVVRDSELLVSSIAGTTRVPQHAPAYSYQINLRRQPWGSPSGQEGELEPVHLGCEVTTTLTLPLDAVKGDPHTHAYATGRTAGTQYQWFQQFNRTAGSIVLLSVPTLDVEPEPQRVREGGLVQIRTTFRSTADAAISSALTTDLARAAFRIHRL